MAGDRPITPLPRLERLDGQAFSSHNTPIRVAAPFCAASPDGNAFRKEGQEFLKLSGYIMVMGRHHVARHEHTSKQS